jgi:8-oxo-dGTP pyrophosphatase MutT (NUDIX family)
MAATALSVDSALPVDWCARLRRGLLSAPDHRFERCRFGALRAPLSDAARDQLRARLPEALHPAAVLLPIVLHPLAPTLLLTVRAAGLRAHAGQISFPGGRLEPRDADLMAAALRETQEEIGLAASAVEPIGFLTDHIVQSGFRVTPVVGLVHPGFMLRPDGAEVSEVFELPLSLALGRSHYRAHQRQLRGVELDLWELPIGERRIWGATAGILLNLRELLEAQHGGLAA